VYEVYLERNAEADLRRVPAEEFERVIEHLKALAVNPRSPGARKIKGTRDDWRIRVGRLRAIYEVDDAARAVRVLRIRSRPRAYG
jgi:mRNA interferase RelE/StbE